MHHDVQAVLEHLLARGETILSIDSIGEAIGGMAISQEEIEQLLDQLERAGKTIAMNDPKLRENLRPVIEQARLLKQASGANPSVSEIAAATHLSVAEVRTALLYASTLGR
jgi:biotin operon repressor